MRGGKQKPLEVLALTTAFMAANLQPTVSRMQSFEASTPVITLAEAPRPDFNFLKSVVRIEVPQVTATTTIATTSTTLPITERPHFEEPPVSSTTPETWIPAPDVPFEQAVQDSVNQVDFAARGLSVAAIVPPERQKRRPQAANEQAQPPAKYFYLLLTRGDGCATAFVIDESKVNETGRFLVHPAFAGQLPDLTDPDFINSRAMYDGNKIIQAEAAEYWITTLDDVPGLFNTTQALCDSYLNNQQVLASQSSSSSQP